MKKRRIKRGLRTLLAWALLTVELLIVMLAGAAAYHQYLMMSDKLQVTKKQVNGTINRQQSLVEQEPVPEVYTVRELTPEELAEEQYYDSLELLAICVEAEAGNQNFTGKRMVAAIILNRVEDADFPDTIEGVITQPYHFSTYWDGAMERAIPSEETYKAVQMELEQRGWPGLLYFTAGNYSVYGTPWKQVGDHYFSTK